MRAPEQEQQHPGTPQYSGSPQHSRSPQGSKDGHWLRNLSLLAVSLLVLLAVAGISLSRRGTQEMLLSDTAFHSGDLRTSIVHAKAAALAYVPGSEHVLAAYARLEAIAKGAEARGDLLLARWAWETLRNVHVATDYPGRPSSALERDATAGIERINSALERRGNDAPARGP
jgi:hypothetical protein